MSNDRELRVKIKTEADLSGLKEHTGALGKAGEAAKEMSKHHGELMRSARELARQFPLVAEGLRLLAGPTGAIVVGIELFDKLREAITEESKALDEQIEKNADPSFLEAINAKKEAVAKFRLELEAYRDKLEHAVDAEGEFKKAIEEEISLLHERAQAQAQVSNAQNGLDNARLEQSYKLGLISAKDYYDQLAALEIQHRNEQLARQQKEDAEELALQNKKLMRAYGRLGQLAVATNRDHGTEEGLTGKVAKDEIDLKNAQDAQAKAKTEALAAKFDLEQQYGSVEHARRLKADGLDPMGTGVTKFLARVDAADQNLTAQDVAVASINARLPGEKSALGSATRAAGRDESETVALTKEVQDLKDTIADLRDKFAVKQGGAADSALRENYATLLKTNPDSLTSAFSLDRAAGTQQALAAHKQVSEADKRFYEAVVQAMEERGQTSQSAHNALALISGTQRTLIEKYQALVREQGYLQSRLGYIGTSPGFP